MQDENKTQNNQKSEENTEISPENKGDLGNLPEQNTAEIPKIEPSSAEAMADKQKEPEITVSAEAETVKEVVVKPFVDVSEVENSVLEEKPISAEPKLEEENVAVNTEITPELEPITEQVLNSEAVGQVELSQTEQPTEPTKTEETQLQKAEQEPIESIVQSAEPQPQTQSQPQVAEPTPTPPQPQPKAPQQSKTTTHKSNGDIVYKYQVPPNFIQNLLEKARARIQERKRKKLDKIMTLFETKSQIRSKDVQKLLFAKKRTVTNYFDQLEKEQKIIQVGEKGKGVSYIKKP